MYYIIEWSYLFNTYVVSISKTLDYWSWENVFHKKDILDNIHGHLEAWEVGQLLGGN